MQSGAFVGAASAAPPPQTNGLGGLLVLALIAVLGIYAWSDRTDNLPPNLDIVAAYDLEQFRGLLKTGGEPPHSHSIVAGGLPLMS